MDNLQLDEMIEIGMQAGANITIPSQIRSGLLSPEEICPLSTLTSIDSRQAE